MEIKGSIDGPDNEHMIWAKVYPVALGRLSTMLRAPIIRDEERKKWYVIAPIGKDDWIIYYMNAAP